MSQGPEPHRFLRPEPTRPLTLREVVIRAISPDSRTLVDVRRDLLRLRRGGKPRLPALYDDSEDVDQLLALVKDELERRGIRPER